jgi:hypothetical protein
VGDGSLDASIWIVATDAVGQCANIRGQRLQWRSKDFGSNIE